MPLIYLDEGIDKRCYSKSEKIGDNEIEKLTNIETYILGRSQQFYTFCRNLATLLKTGWANREFSPSALACIFYRTLEDLKNKRSPYARDDLLFELSNEAYTEIKNSLEVILRLASPEKQYAPDLMTHADSITYADLTVHYLKMSLLSERRVEIGEGPKSLRLK